MKRNIYIHESHLELFRMDGHNMEIVPVRFKPSSQFIPCVLDIPDRTATITEDHFDALITNEPALAQLPGSVERLREAIFGTLVK